MPRFEINFSYDKTKRASTVHELSALSQNQFRVPLPHLRMGLPTPIMISISMRGPGRLLCVWLLISILFTKQINESLITEVHA